MLWSWQKQLKGKYFCLQLHNCQSTIASSSLQAAPLCTVLPSHNSFYRSHSNFESVSGLNHLSGQSLQLYLAPGSPQNHIDSCVLLIAHSSRSPQVGGQDHPSHASKPQLQKLVSQGLAQCPRSAAENVVRKKGLVFKKIFQGFPSNMALGLFTMYTWGHKMSRCRLRDFRHVKNHTYPKQDHFCNSAYEASECQERTWPWDLSQRTVQMWILMALMTDCLSLPPHPLVLVLWKIDYPAP